MRYRKCLPMVAGLALALLGGMPDVQGKDNEHVVVAVAPAPDMALLIVAVKKGFLAEQGLDPELKIFDSSPKAVQALVAGQGDITENTEPPHLAARAHGGKVVQVMTGYMTGQTNCVVVNSKAITTHADFTGKTVGVQQGSGSNYHLAWFLNRYNVPADKVNVRYMAAPDQIAALARGDVQAIFTWEPFCSRAAQSIPNAKVFSRAMDDGLEFRGNVLMREAIANDDKPKAVKIVKGLIAASDWLNAHMHEAAAVSNEVLRAPSVADVEQQLKIFKWPADFMKSVIAQEDRIAEWGAGIGLFPTKDAKELVQELIDPAVIKAAAPNRTDM
jgi:NitT/TauT family transport system substrate-binding protein